MGLKGLIEKLKEVWPKIEISVVADAHVCFGPDYWQLDYAWEHEEYLENYIPIIAALALQAASDEGWKYWASASAVRLDHIKFTSTRMQYFGTHFSSKSLAEILVCIDAGEITKNNTLKGAQ